MYRIQLGLAAISQLIGLVLALIAISHLNWLAAMGWFLTGFMAALFFFSLPDPIWEEWWYQFLAGAALCIALWGAFLSPAADVDLHKARHDLVEAFMWADSGLSVRLNAAERGLAQKGLKICAMEGITDLSNLTSELQKAYSYGPVMTLADGVASALKEEKPMSCLSYYHALRMTKPAAFSFFERKNPWVVAKLAGVPK